jgi:hypothetical protein
MDPAGLVLVRNDTGADLPQFGVVSLAYAPFWLSENMDEPHMHSHPPVVGGNLPNLSPAVPNGHDENFAVTTEPIKAGRVGRAVTAGVTFVQIEVAANTNTPLTAGVGHGITDRLIAGKPGANVLWLVSGTGTKWGCVLLGRPRRPGRSNCFVCHTSTVWTTPKDVSVVEIIAVGGGGGGSKQQTNPITVDFTDDHGDEGTITLGYITGGGGGAGGSVWGTLRVNPGDQLTITIGAGGTGGGQSGANGGNTTVSGTTRWGASDVTFGFTAGGGSGASDFSGGNGGVASNSVGLTQLGLGMTGQSGASGVLRGTYSAGGFPSLSPDRVSLGTRQYVPCGEGGRGGQTSGEAGASGAVAIIW